MKNRYTRREALELRLGAAVLGATGAAAAVAQSAQKPGSKQEGRIPDLDAFKKYGEDLEIKLILRTSLIALKMLEKESEIPEGAFRPKKDGGYHIAQCQAFGMSRREGKTVAMLKEDHWCPTALMSYGLVERPGNMRMFGESFGSFETGKYVGTVTGLLKSASYIPDVVLIYCNPAQIRALLLTMYGDGESQVSTHMFLPSCKHSVVDPMETGKFCIVLPDPGEHQRVLTLEEEMIFAVPKEKMSTLMAGVNSRGFSHRGRYMSMLPDFEQPQFYKDMFKSWGLDSE